MRRESAIIFILSLLLAAGIVSGANYWYVYRNADQPTASQQTSLLSLQLGSKGDQQRIPQRTDTPIECQLPDGSTFWTNATRCEDADLDNRISIADPVQRIYTRPATNSVRKQTRRHSQKLARKPNLRGPGRSPPPDAPTECRFALGRALEIERSLSAADDPGKSIWHDSYCRWLKDARGDGCEISREYFYYTHLCAGFGP